MRTLILLIFFLFLMIFFLVKILPVTEHSNFDKQLCDAIFLAEGGDRATYLYGIRSVEYKDKAEAREICLRTVKNNRSRYAQIREQLPFLEFLASRYCPVDKKNWLKNVLYFLEKGGKR